MRIYKYNSTDYLRQAIRSDADGYNVTKTVTNFCLENFEMHTWGLVVSNVRLEETRTLKQVVTLVFDKQEDQNYFNLTFPFEKTNVKITYFK
jgi:PKD repeat protein